MKKILPAETRLPLKKLKTFGIVISIAMIILGVISSFSPLLGQSIVIWMMVGGLFIYGIEEIVNYCAAPKCLKNGFSLASGIIWVVLCVILFVSALGADTVSKLFALGAFDYFIAVIISFSCIFNAVNDFCVCGKAEEMGRSKGGMIAAGILELLAGFAILSYPIGSVITLEIFYAIFLTAGGIALLCRCLAYNTGK